MIKLHQQFDSSTALIVGEPKQLNVKPPWINIASILLVNEPGLRNF